MTKLGHGDMGASVAGVVPNQPTGWISDHFHVPFYGSGALSIREPHFYQDVSQCNVSCLLEQAKEAQ